MTEGYDVVVIGSGPGGYVAGIRAGQLGLRTAVVEKEPRLGGVCLHWGCIPTKALIKNAEVVELVSRRAGDYGVQIADYEISWPAGVKRSRRVVKRMAKGVESLFKKNGVTWVRGRASFLDAHTLAISSDEPSAPSRLRAEHVVVATGSHAALLPEMTADGQRIITSRHAVALDEVPQRLVVLGAGAVGMEFAFIYRAYGAEVTIVEMMDSVLPLEDPEAGAAVAKSFRRRGIDVRTGTRVEGFEVTDDEVRLTAVAEGEEQTIVGDVVLVAIGRVPNSNGIDLESTGIAVEEGFIAVDERLRTAVSHVLAIGDVVGSPMLAHKASHQGVQAAEEIAGLEPHPLDAYAVPSCTYCHPQVASVGRTEEQARADGYEVSVSKFPFSAIGKAVAIGDHEGWVKIVADAKYGEILGATVVGPEATEIVHEIVLARTAELTADELVAAVHAHPTLSEAIYEAARGVTGSPINI